MSKETLEIETHLAVFEQLGDEEPGEVLLEHGRDVEVEQLAQDGLQVGVGGVHGLGKPGITRFVFFSPF